MQKLAPTAFHNSLRDVLVVGDSDDDAGENWKNIKKQLDKIDWFSPPSQPNKRNRGDGAKPRCSVLMVPWTNEEGALETLLKESAIARHRTAASQVDSFMTDIRAYQWASQARRDKAWLRVNLSIRCDDPSAALGDMMQKNKHKYLLPMTLKGPMFRRLRDFLADFS